MAEERVSFGDREEVAPFDEYDDKHVFVLGARCIKVARSGEAVLVQLPGVADPVWIPVSQVHEDSEVWKENTDGKLVITKWIAEKKELWSE